MIRFYRIIRQQLLTENKFSKYLIYAIGEIVLVVVGILIALGVNNWNQENKNHKSGEELLLRIHHDLVQDTAGFRAIINDNNALRKDIKDLLITIYSGVDSIQQVQYLAAVFDKALDQVFSPNDKTYKSMISSGTVGLIQNIQLREEIISLYSNYDERRALLASVGEWMVEMAVKLDTETDFIKFNTGVSDIFTSKQMLNENDYSFMHNPEDERFKILVRAISATAFVQTANNANYLELIDRCETVLQHIDQEVN